MQIQRGARQELAEFTLAEIDRVAPAPGEDEELAAIGIAAIAVG